MDTEWDLDSKWNPMLVSMADSPVAVLDAIEDSLQRGDIVPALGMVRSIRRQLAHPVRSSVVTRFALTERELSALEFLPDATFSQKDIARALGISRNTLKTHLRSLYQKLGVHSRAEAIELAGLSGGAQAFMRRRFAAGAVDRPERTALGVPA